MKSKRIESSSRLSQTEVTQFGELRPGDVIEGVDGPVTVTKVYDEHVPESMYRVTIDDGTVVDVSGNHLWYVVTEFDKALHRRRVREHRRKLRKSLTEEHVEFLREVVESDGGPLEISLDDLIGVLDAVNDWLLIDVLVRVAESIGHVAEENIIEAIRPGKVQNSMRIYDARAFCGQLMALYDRRFAKTNPVLKGRVVSTETLVGLSIDYDIPAIKRS